MIKIENQERALQKSWIIHLLFSNQMRKDCKQLVVFISFVLAICCQDCNPLYLRLFYNPESDPVLKVDMIVMFNTLDKCSDCYIQTTYLNSQAEFACTVNMIQIVQDNKTFLQQWVHTCNLQLDSPSQIDNFNYRVQGGQENTNFSLVQLTSDSLPFIAVVTANLNFLDDQKYIPFAQAFQELLSRRTAQITNKEGMNHYRINAIVINGGFAENLRKDRGNNFNKIMTLLGQYSNRWPLLLNIGPNEINNPKDFSLIQACFVFGGLQGDQPTGMQSYSFSRKVNIILLQTSTQNSGTSTTQLSKFQQTLSQLSSFLKDSQEQDNDFIIAFNHYSLSCNNADNNSDQNCDQGTDPLFDLLTGSHGQNNKPIDLYVTAYQNNYQRNYPIKNGSYDTEQDFIFHRGEFVALNQGAGDFGLHSKHDMMRTSNKVIYKQGKPGFGIITIHGDGDLPKQNASLIRMNQKLVRKIEKDQSIGSIPKKLEHKDKDQQVLDEAYLHNQDLDELDLFLLNYKHITINGTQLIVEDVFRIITQPVTSTPVLRHHLTVT